jgi:beta-glucosidase
MNLPSGIDELITRVVAANPNTIVVNQTGTPITMPWIDSVKAVVQAWYGGNETGNGISDILFGDINPGGKLPLSWPRRVEDNPTYFNFGSVRGRVLYGEDIYVGYRYFDKVKLNPLFSFG